MKAIVKNVDNLVSTWVNSVSNEWAKTLLGKTIDVENFALSSYICGKYKIVFSKEQLELVDYEVILSFTKGDGRPFYSRSFWIACEITKDNVNIIGIPCKNKEDAETILSSFLED